MFQSGCSLGSGGHCGVGGQEAGMKLGREGTRRGASPSKGKRRGAARSLCIIGHVKSGQVALVPQRTQLCQGFSEHGLGMGLLPLRFTPSSLRSSL